MSLPLLRRAVEMSLACQSRPRSDRQQQFEYLLAYIRCVEHRKAKARKSHRKRRMRELKQQNIDLTNCRCCAPPDT